jgi:hypothetical protein
MFKHKGGATALSTANERPPADAAARHTDYVTQVTHLVDDQSAVLFRLVSAAAAQASTAAEHIDVRCAARSLTASAGAHTAVFQVEAITDRPEDLGRARTYLGSQARCILSTPDGPAAPTGWVLALQRNAAGETSTSARHAYLWMDARAVQPLTEAVVASTLRSLFP